MTIEKTLFAVVDKMRGSMGAGEYNQVALGLLFLRYVSVYFGHLHDQLSQEEFSDAENPDEYLAENVFWVPEKVCCSTLATTLTDTLLPRLMLGELRVSETRKQVTGHI